MKTDFKPQAKVNILVTLIIHRDSALELEIIKLLSSTRSSDKKETKTICDQAIWEFYFFEIQVR